jgi:Fe-S oxidoreductase
MAEAWVLRLLVLLSLALFARQMARRARLVARARNNFTLQNASVRLLRVLREVVLQSKVIAERPVVGVSHALVFWGFVAFAGFSAGAFLREMRIADVTATGWFRSFTLALVPFAMLVLIGISILLVRRVILRPEALGPTVSAESSVIGSFIAILMVTFLLDFRLTGWLVQRVNWWIHALVLLCFLVLIPGSKHLHLVLSPVTIFLRSEKLGTVRNLDFEREEVGFEKLGSLESKQVLDAFTCVECGRCQVNCPAQGTGKVLNPKTLILQGQEALLGGRLELKLGDLYDAGAIWQCTVCGACENQCPVGIEHLPLIIGARRGMVSNGEAPDFLVPVYSNLERRGNIWGLTYDQRAKFVTSAGLEFFDASRHEYLVWLGCAGAFESDFQKALRSLFGILRARGVTFGVLPRERCTGDLAKRTGNEFLFQQLAQENVASLQAAEAKKILTSCPHCLKTLGDDYREFGFQAEVVHSAVFVSSLTSGGGQPGRDVVTFHDPCYLGRHAGHVEEPRDLLRRLGVAVREPARSRANPFCCGAGGGLLFEDHERGRRISQERLEQLQATGADTVVTACPFCAIMLKGAQTSANASTRIVDLMSYIGDRLGSTTGAAVLGP